MKKIAMLLAAVSMLALAGCWPGTEYSSGGVSITFYTDKATGCHYLVQSQGGIYPRRGMDEPEVCKK